MRVEGGRPAAGPGEPSSRPAPGRSDGYGRSHPSVLHVLDTEEYAGRESVVEKLARGQCEAGADVRVACVVEEGTGDPPFLDAARREPPIPTDVLRIPPRAYLREWRSLVDVIRRVDPDVIHTHGYRPDVVGRAAAARTGAASVSTVHGLTGGGLRNRLYETLQCLSLRWFDAVVAVSRGIAVDLRERGVGGGRIHVVPNAWGGRDDFLSRSEARGELSVGEGEFLAGWVGRVSREKGLDVLVEALKEPRLDDVTVSVVGDGPRREALARRARDLPPGRQVRWHGAIPGAYRFFPAFDAFVLSSRREGTPMVLLEAMAAEVPVVATSVGGVPDVVTTNEALLVPPEDAGALADALASVREHPRAARRRATAGRRRLDEEFGLASWVARYAAVYRSVAQSPRTPGRR